jgi:membrane protease YdiL (CAAX protease family)
VNEVTLKPATSRPTNPAEEFATGSVWLVVAFAVSVAVVVGAQLWFRAVQHVWPTDDPTVVGLQFGSFLLLAGGIAGSMWRGDLGLRVGTSHTEWRRIAAWAAVLALGTVLLMVVWGSNDYSGSDPLFETVLVPVGEELVFRGLLLGILLDQLRRRFGAGTGESLAIVFSALAFGAAHASNVLFGVTPSFVAVQVAAATALGLIFAHLRVRTGSSLAPVLLHALVNGINLLA